MEGVGAMVLSVPPVAEEYHFKGYPLVAVAVRALAVSPTQY